MWQYRDDSMKFVDFPSKPNEILEAAWKTFHAAPEDSSASLRNIGINIGGTKYIMDLELQTQTNTKTNKVRFLRRIDPHGEVTTHAPQWEWHCISDGGEEKWTPYDPRESEAIEKAFVSNQLSVKVNVAHGAHDAIPVVVHFGHMHQLNPETGTTRAVRRRTVLRLPQSAAGGRGGAGATTRGGRGAHAGGAAATPASPEPATKKRGREVGVVDADAPAATRGPFPGTSGSGVTIPPIGGALPCTALPSTGMWTRPQTTLLQLFAHAAPSTSSARRTIAIAGFDMDDTLVFPKTGQTFAKSRTDWQWLHSSVPHRLRQLHETGYAVVIFTNQGGIGNKAWDEAKATEIRGKIIDLSASIGIPLSAWIACKEDHLRKPGTEMWQLAVKAFEDTNAFTVDKAKSFYVGDAAGRAIMTMAARKKDFSCSDRKFARNCGIAFYTPEEFYLGAKAAPFDWDGIGPTDLDALRHNVLPTDDVLFPPGSSQNELVIFVGFPGSGKSAFFERFFKARGYVHANRDTLKTKEKCAAVAAEALKKGVGAVIDNTNPTAADRKMYIDIAKAQGRPVRCVQFDVPRLVANHMNIFRARLGISERVSSIAYNIFQSNFQAPATSEGFSQIVKVPVVLNFTGLPAGAEALFFELS